MLIRQVRIILQVSDMIQKNKTTPTDQIARTLSIHPFVAKKTVSLVSSLTPGKAEHMHNFLLHGDMAIKTGKQSPDEVLEFFITQTTA
jgi:DNA polymerase III delta subunit